MYITSAARPRFDITYYINKLRIVQNRRLHNNCWLMTLPLWCKLNSLTCATSSETRYIFKQGIHLHNDHLILPHHVPFMWMPSKPVYIAYQFENAINTTIIRFYRTFSTTTMDTVDYRQMAWEYSIWNATIASLQFWTEDLDPVTLGRATEHVYTTFFYTPTSHTLHQQSDETLFGCFVIALNAAFNQQLSVVDEGYESSSDTIDLPTLL